jgi:metal-sulfur cluster biosynthetic enzyme
MTENTVTESAAAENGATTPAEASTAEASTAEASTTGASTAEASTTGASTTGPAALTEEQEDVLEALRDVVDPELGINVVDLGLIYGVDVDADRANAIIDMTLTSAACPLTDVIEDQACEALEGVVNDFRINWVWLPPWGPESITEDGREQLRALGFNI